MEPIVPQNVSQCAFDFDALSRADFDDTPLQVNQVPSQKRKYCRQCRQYCPIVNFSRNRLAKDKLQRYCKSCRHDNYIADLERDPEYTKKANQRAHRSFLAKSPEEQDAIRERDRQSSRKYYAARIQEGICGRCRSRPCVPGHTCCEQCRSYSSEYNQNSDREIAKARAQRSRERLRDEVIAIYG